MDNEVDNADATTSDTTAADTFRFNLKGVARDRQGSGDIGTNDIISVVVNGRTALASTDTNAPWFTVVKRERTARTVRSAGGGIVAVVLHNVVPQNADNSVAITFKDTEFEFTSDTPLELEETRVRYAGRAVRASLLLTHR